MVTAAKLTLSEAAKTGRLQQFIAEQEARGVGPINRADFDSLLGKAAKSPQSKGQTSHSPSGGSSTGKRTRQDRRPSAQR
jgi:hypothetical protein